MPPENLPPIKFTQAEAPPPTPFGNLGDYLAYQTLTNGTLRLLGEIEDYDSDDILDRLEFLRRRGTSPITLAINSGGGSVTAALSIYDQVLALRRSGVTVNTLVEGLAASAAAMIVLQAGQTRFARPHSRILLHEISQFRFGNESMSQTEDSVAEMAALSQMVYGILSARSGKPVAEIEVYVKHHERWMSAEAAVTWGALDAIIG